MSTAQKWARAAPGTAKRRAGKKAAKSATREAVPPVPVVETEKKKKKGKKRREATRITYHNHLARDEAVAYLEAVIAGLKRGSIRFKQGGEDLVFHPADMVEVAIKGETTASREEIAFAFKWNRDNDAVLDIS